MLWTTEVNSCSNIDSWAAAFGSLTFHQFFNVSLSQKGHQSILKIPKNDAYSFPFWRIRSGDRIVGHVIKYRLNDALFFINWKLMAHNKEYLSSVRRYTFEPILEQKHSSGVSVWQSHGCWNHTSWFPRLMKPFKKAHRAWIFVVAYFFNVLCERSLEFLVLKLF